MSQILTPTIFQSQLIRYLGVSVSGTAAHYLVLPGLYHVGLNPLLASTYGALVGALVIYMYVIIHSLLTVLVPISAQYQDLFSLRELVCWLTELCSIAP